MGTGRSQVVKSIVLDNSALMPLFFPDEASTFAEHILKLGEQGALLLSSSFVQIEFGNAIVTGVRRGRLNPAQAAFAHGQFRELPIELVDYVNTQTLLTIHGIAVQQQLSFYDALYLAFAMEEGAALATLDGGLRRAAKAIGVEALDRN